MPELRPQSIQVVLPAPERPPLLASLPAVLRTAHLLSARPEIGRILLWDGSGRFGAAWGRALRRVPRAELAPAGGLPAPADPLLILSPEGCPAPAALGAMLLESAHAKDSSAWVWKGRQIAVCRPAGAGGLPGGFPQTELDSPRARRVELREDAWTPLRSPEDLRDAERRLFDGLRQESDGYLARFDRSLSIPLSRLLLRTPVTPNQITTFSLAVGLWGAWLLAFGARPAQLLGAALLCSVCVLDGCDGEVARLKLLCSPWGARYDVIADNVVHVAAFAAIVVHLQRERPDMDWLLPGVLMLSGVGASMLAVWLLILRQPGALSPEVERFYERVASRDFLYLVLVLTALGRLEWFVWGAAVGAQLFWLTLFALSLRGRS